MLVPIAVILFAFGYVLQAGLINPFISRPEHSQFLLMVAIAIMIANVLLIMFGPNAQNVQNEFRRAALWKLDRFLNFRSALRCGKQFAKGPTARARNINKS